LLVLSLLGVVYGQTKTKPSIAKQSPLPKPSAAQITEARQLLSSLGYWVNSSGETVDVSLRHALIAFQKISTRPRTGELSPDELAALRLAQRPLPHEVTGAHLEIDLDRQVLFVVNEQGLVERILPVSTGSGAWFTEGGRTRRALTPQGRFKIQRKIAGWRKSALGLLYYPSYFHDGVALHGNPSVPVTPASHGCVRVPMFAAKELFEATPVGTVVLVYGTAPAPSAPPEPCQPLPATKK
jgi:hypothetical protein